MTIIFASLFVLFMIALTIFPVMTIRQGIRHRFAMNYIAKNNPAPEEKKDHLVLTSR